jgi:pimeloyl-ACP methyl ester carboxylesterase
MKRFLAIAALVALPVSAQKFEFPGQALPTPSPSAAPSPTPSAIPAATPAPVATVQVPSPQKAPDPSVVAAPSAGEKFAVVYGNRLRYVDSGGSGPVIVLLHGMGNDSEAWAFNTPALSRNFRVIALDQLGYGKSDKPLVNYRVALWVDFLDRFLRELKVEKVSLVGASLGGWIAASYALEHPDRVERLVLISTGGYPLPEGVGEKELRLLNPSTRAEVRVLLDAVFVNPLLRSEQALDFVYAKRMSAGDGWTNRAMIESMLRNEDVIGARFREIRTPTLLVWGRDDRMTPLKSIGEPLSRDIPGSKLVVIDAAGHLPQIEQAAKFNEVAGEFLAGR